MTGRETRRGMGSRGQGEKETARVKWPFLPAGPGAIGQFYLQSGLSIQDRLAPAVQRTTDMGNIIDPWPGSCDVVPVPWEKAATADAQLAPESSKQDSYCEAGGGSCRKPSHILNTSEGGCPGPVPSPGVCAPQPTPDRRSLQALRSVRPPIPCSTPTRLPVSEPGRHSPSPGRCRAIPAVTKAQEQPPPGHCWPPHSPSARVVAAQHFPGWGIPGNAETPKAVLPRLHFASSAVGISPLPSPNVGTPGGELFFFFGTCLYLTFCPLPTWANQSSILTETKIPHPLAYSPDGLHLPGPTQGHSPLLPPQLAGS